jgi:transcriptional regulator
MARDDALTRLPEVHRKVLELVAQGLDHHDQIAARLEIDHAAVSALVVVAHRKLDRATQAIDHESQGAAHATLD